MRGLYERAPTVVLARTPCVCGITGTGPELKTKAISIAREAAFSELGHSLSIVRDASDLDLARLYDRGLSTSSLTKLGRKSAESRLQHNVDRLSDLRDGNKRSSLAEWKARYIMQGFSAEDQNAVWEAVATVINPEYNETDPYIRFVWDKVGAFALTCRQEGCRVREMGAFPTV